MDTIEPGRGVVALRRDPYDRLPHEGSIEAEADELFEDGRAWLEAKHPMLGAQRPIDLIGTPAEQMVRNLLRGIRYITVS